MSNIHIIIPARMGSARLFGKPLLEIQGKSTVQRVWEQAQKVEMPCSILVATDHGQILQHCIDIGADVVMTPTSIESGTDRVAHCAELYPDTDIVVNLQGDLPFVDPRVVEQVCEGLLADTSADICTPANKRPASEDEWMREDAVKVVMNNQGHALYFSRSPIPSDIVRVGYWHHHFGIYAFRNKALQVYSKLRQSSLEFGEGLEQLRALQFGMNILVVETPYQAGQEINTIEDLRSARTDILVEEV